MAIDDATQIQQAFERFSWSVKTTASCRFNASKRLNRLNFHLTACIAIASVYILGMSILLILFQYTDQNSKLISFVSIIGSITVIVASMFQYAGNFSPLAERHQRCGLELNHLKQQIDAMPPSARTADELKSMTERYNSILKTFEQNHDPIDYFKFQISYNKRYGVDLNWAQVIWRHFVLFTHEYAAYAITSIVCLGPWLFIHFSN